MLKIYIQRFFVCLLTEMRTYYHGDEGYCYTDENLMDSGDFKAEKHGNAVNQCATYHG